jgi:CDP-diglyceride synthetase
MKPTKTQLAILGGWIAFVIVFWFLGPTQKMDKATAFFGLAAITLVYAGIVWVVTKVYPKKPAA